MSTYYDDKAARLAARGEAERARAEAEQIRAQGQADREAAADERRRDQREHSAQRRRQALARAAAWARAHVLDLVFVPVIVVPAVLAWTAIAAYGIEVYGPLGMLLPAFSEGAMWAFAAATTISVRRDPSVPVGTLKAGTAAFALVAAVLNFLHGLHLEHVGGVATGVVMALVSVGGVVAHQLVTAGPMRSRVQRDEARLDRQAQRRRTTLRRVALRQAPAELDVDGTVRLLHRPGQVTVSRSWLGRRRLVPTVVPGLPVTPLGDELDAELAALLDEAPEPPRTAQTHPAVEAGTEDGELDAHLAQVREAITTGLLPSAPSRRAVQRHLRVRSELAQRVCRALRSDSEGGEGVPA